MIPIPADVQAATDGAHAPQWFARLGAQLTPDDSYTVNILGGQITKDSARYPRNRASLTVPATQIGAPPDEALPFGTHADIWWQLDGQVFRIFSGFVVASRLDRPDGTWELSLADASAICDVDTMTRGEFVWVADETVADYVERQLLRTFPTGFTYTPSGDALTDTVGGLDPRDDDLINGSPWAAIEAVVESSGSEAWFDHDHTLIVRDVPDLAAPSAVLSATTNVTSYTVGFERGYSRVVIDYVDDPGAQIPSYIKGEWEDTRTNSPTHVNQIGRVTLHEERIGSPTQQRANRAAQRLAKKVAARARQVAITCVTKPWIVPGDTIAMQFADEGTPESLLVTEVDIDLSGEPMTLQTRTSQYKSGTPV